MSEAKLTVRFLERPDHARIVDYFLNSDHSFLINMGVDVNKLPPRDKWLSILEDNYDLGIPEKHFFYIIWLLDKKPVGHSNINKIIYGKEAHMHLHLWETDNRQRGMGLDFLRLTIPLYFNIFNLQELFCEPYTANPAPNLTLQKAGFELIRTYETTPGWINSFQTVNRWSMTKDRFEHLYHT